MSSMHTTHPQPISSNSVASELIARHLRATSVERQVSPAAIALVVALMVVPLALLLLSQKF
jgi:hypothetical protein